MNDLIKFTSTVRKEVLELSYLSNAGHVPSALSMVDYLSVIFCLYFDPNVETLILGKPYGAQTYYSIFANLGWISKEWHKYGGSDPLWSYAIGREHPLVKYMDDTMGNSLSVACGVAMATPEKKVLVNTSDATCQMGTFWEGVAFAGHRGLSNLILTIDFNNMQVLGNVSDIMSIEPLSDKFHCYKWRVLVVDGHDLNALQICMNEAFASSLSPTVVICHTVKGRGVSFMEGDASWHYEQLDERTYHRALEDLVTV